MVDLGLADDHQLHIVPASDRGDTTWLWTCTCGSSGEAPTMEWALDQYVDHKQTLADQAEEGDQR